jgi:hypothetical protein
MSLGTVGSEQALFPEDMFRLVREAYRDNFPEEAALGEGCVGERIRERGSVRVRRRSTVLEDKLTDTASGPIYFHFRCGYSLMVKLYLILQLRTVSSSNLFRTTEVEF